MQNNVIKLCNEPIIECDCGCNSWYLRCEPDRQLRHIISFECARCGARIECDIRLVDAKENSASLNHNIITKK